MSKSPFINQRHIAEYLITNGLDGFASSTTLNLNTRKYHGLLIIADHYKNNYVILSGIDERIEINGKIYELGSHHYKADYDPEKEDIFFPQGFKFLKKFEYTDYTFPKFYYKIEDIGIEKEILMPHGKNIVIVHYKINKDNKDNRIKYSLSPLMNMRGIHKNLHIQNKDEFSCEVFADKKGIIVSHNEMKVYLISDIEFLKDEHILRNVFYQKEWERGYDPFEDLYSPGYFVGDKDEVTVVASMSFGDFRDATGFGIASATNETKIYEKYKKKEILHINELFASLNNRSQIFQKLSLIADKLIISCYNGYGIIAGYHWFDEWGRDTMISIPGLCLTTGRYKIARSIIKRWLNFMRNALLPNFIPVRYPFECPYNSSDASLWLFNAVYFYYLYTKDMKFIEEIYQRLCEIIEGYVHGNPAGRMDNDCLIISNPETTWMDTKWTKRKGKCVEINALWYNALSVLKFFSKLLDKQFKYEEILRNVKENFEIFWNPAKECLYDVILNTPDDSIRPNQIFAVSLPFNVIDDERKMKKIFNVVFEELYTPYGLRTLSRKDKRYRGIYEGNEEKRDKAYHNGTVWPWLIGGFIDAYLKINNYSKKSKQEAVKFLTPLLEYAERFGAIPEIFDGDPPHTPRGCIAQAWSIAEVLRAWNLLNH